MLNSTPCILILDPDAASRRIISQFLARFLAEESGPYTLAAPESAAHRDALGAAPYVLWVGEAAPDLPDADLFSHPVRIGALLDRIGALLRRRRKDARLRPIQIGPYHFDPDHKILHCDGEPKEPSIDLTDKECALLLLLHKKRGHTVSRQELLSKIWGYADGLETHTLETHIYRLRQKIERDPSLPALLITRDAGYLLDV